MVLDVAISTGQTSQPFRGTSLKHSPNEFDGRAIDAVVVSGDVPFAAHDAFEESFLVDSPFVEGGGAEEHFVDEASEGPVVDSAIVACVRCRVVSCGVVDGVKWNWMLWDDETRR